MSAPDDGWSGYRGSGLLPTGLRGGLRVRYQAVVGFALAGALLAGCGDTVASPPTRKARASDGAQAERS